MSMPKFTKPCKILTREAAISAILSSIGMEESALSHVLNAEGEKINYLSNPQMLLAVNKSTALLVDVATDTQIMLKNKMNMVVNLLPLKPPHKQQPHTKPYMPRNQEFLASTKHKWLAGSTLRLEERNRSDNNNSAYILLAAHVKHKIGMDLKLLNKSLYPVLIEMRIACYDEVILKRNYSFEAGEEIIHIEDRLELPAQHKTCKIFVRLLSQNKLDIESGIILVHEW